MLMVYNLYIVGSLFSTTRIFSRSALEIIPSLQLNSIINLNALAAPSSILSWNSSITVGSLNMAG